MFHRSLSSRAFVVVATLMVAMVAGSPVGRAEDTAWLAASPVDGLDGVYGCGWQPSTSTTIEVDSPATGPGTDYTYVIETDASGCFGTPSDSWTFDLEPGDAVRVSDGVTSKDLVISAITVGVDAYRDLVSGWATPGSRVAVIVGDGNVDVHPDADGHYEVDFTGVADIQHGTTGSVIEFDADDDGTAINWTYWTGYEPTVSVHYDAMPGGTVHLLDWPEGHEVSIEVGRDGTLVYGEVVTPSGGEDEATMTAPPHASPDAPFVTRPGDVVTATNGARTKTHVVFDLAIDAIDFDDDRVHGTTDDASIEVCVDVWTTGASRCVTPSPDGSWTVDLLASGIDDPIPLDWNTDLAAWQHDTDGDSTEMNNHRIPAPVLGANLDSSPWLDGVFTPGSVVEFTIDDPGTTVSPDWTYTAASPRCLDDPDCDPGISIDVDALEPGFIITADDGYTAKSHTVLDLTLTAADLSSATITGTAPAGTPMGVFAHSYTDDNGVPVRWPVVDETGVWTADFSVPGSDGSEQHVIPTFGPGDHFHVAAWEQEGDGDSTNVRLNTTLGDIAVPTAPVATDTETLTVGATLIEPGDDPHVVAVVDWGDGTTSQMEQTPPDHIGGDIGLTGTHIYDSAGVYPLRVTVTHDSGHTETQVAGQVVVYDRTGLVVGAGSIWSPAGAYAEDPDLEGRAGFVVVARYRRDATEPNGLVVWRMAAADLWFQSTSLTWLVVPDGEHAQLDGTGTINGEGPYRFRLWAEDGTGADTVRIRIWSETPEGVEHLVYDTGDGQEVAFGRIVVNLSKRR